MTEENVVLFYLILDSLLRARIQKILLSDYIKGMSEFDKKHLPTYVDIAFTRGVGARAEKIAKKYHKAFTMEDKNYWDDYRVLEKLEQLVAKIMIVIYKEKNINADYPYATFYKLAQEQMFDNLTEKEEQCI